MALPSTRRQRHPSVRSWSDASTQPIAADTRDRHDVQAPIPPVQPRCGAFRVKAAVSISLAGRVAVITGAGTGIGAAMARLFARAGATVVVTGLQPAKLEEVAAACRDDGGEAWACAADVAAPDDVSVLFDEVRKRCGRLDILVNNAAPTDASTRKSFAEHTDADWARFFEVIVLGTARCCSVALPLLKPSRGVILNISSVHASIPRNAAAYGAAKAAIENLTLKLAAEFAADGVRANALAPGWIETEGISWSLVDREAVARAVEQRIPLNRLGHVDEIAHVALFLVSDLASYMTGAVVPVDGGWMLR